MEIRNQTTVTYFILIGFNGAPRLKITLFIIVFLIYIVSMIGNVGMIIIIWLDHRLHAPMYYFLWNISLLEIMNISNIIPLTLKLTYSVYLPVPKAYCLTQSFFFFYLATVVLVLLPIMSYDRFVAVCNPLRYATIMTHTLCIQLVTGTWLATLVYIICPFIVITRLPFCGPNVINHFFCDTSTIVKLACSDTGVFQLLTGGIALIMLLSSLGFIIASYAFIIAAVFRIQSTTGRQKVFSTCSSHLMMVSIVYGGAIFVELSPALNPPIEIYKGVFMATGLLAPLMNPFVYTFRNEKVKEVIKGYLHFKMVYN